MIERMKLRARLIRPLLIPLIFYVGLLAFAFRWINAYPDSNRGYAITLLLIIPGLFIARGMFKAIMQVDELERKNLIEGIIFSFSVTLIIVLSMGLLGVAGVPQLNGIYIAFIMVVLWLVGKLWSARRYR